MSRMSPSLAAASSSVSTPSARHMRRSVPNWLMRSGCCEPFGFSNRSAGPPALTTRSTISVISRSGSTSAVMRRSSPSRSRSAIHSRRSRGGATARVSLGRRARAARPVERELPPGLPGQRPSSRVIERSTDSCVCLRRASAPPSLPAASPISSRRISLAPSNGRGLSWPVRRARGRRACQKAARRRERRNGAKSQIPIELSKRRARLIDGTAVQGDTREVREGLRRSPSPLSPLAEDAERPKSELARLLVVSPRTR